MSYRVHVARSETLEDGHEKSARLGSTAIERSENKLRDVGDVVDGPRRQTKSLNDSNDASEEGLRREVMRRPVVHVHVDAPEEYRMGIPGRPGNNLDLQLRGKMTWK